MSRRRARARPEGARFPMDRLRLTVAVVIAAAFPLLLSIVLLVAFWPRSHDAGPLKAVIVDQLALTDPNPAFVSEATSELQDAGYQVAYVPPEAVTVDFYRTLPKQGYDVIVLRSHSSSERIERAPGAVDTGATPPAAEDRVAKQTVGIFTNEPYSTERYIDDQLQRRLSVSSYPNRGIDQTYFGIDQEFIASGTQGRFRKTVVILMGCGGLSSDTMGQAFIGKGARAFISWDNLVTAEHTDQATEALLKNLFAGQLDAAAAVEQTMAQVGPDPSFASRLHAYP